MQLWEQGLHAFHNVRCSSWSASLKFLMRKVNYLCDHFIPEVMRVRDNVTASLKHEVQHAFVGLTFIFIVLDQDGGVDWER